MRSSFLICALAATATAGPKWKTRAKAKAECMLDGGGSLRKVTAKLAKDVVCSVNIAHFDDDVDSDYASIHLVSWATWKGPKGEAQSPQKSNGPDSSVKFGSFMPIGAADLPACHDFTIHLQLTSGDQPVWQQDQAVTVSCPKPKPIAAALSCAFEAQDGTMFKWPGNGAKVKPRLGGGKELDCRIFAKTVPANVALTGTIKVKDGKGKAQSELAHDVPNGGTEADAAFTTENGDFDECANFTLEGSLVDGDGATRWTGSLKIAQNCPD